MEENTVTEDKKTKLQAATIKSSLFLYIPFDSLSLLDLNNRFSNNKTKTSWLCQAIQTFQFCCQVDGTPPQKGNHHLSSLPSLSITLPAILHCKTDFSLVYGPKQSEFMINIRFKRKTLTSNIYCCWVICNMKNRALPKIKNIFSDPFLELKNMHHLQQTATVEWA